ncbi:MAG: hypothetical protein KGQ67_06945 [Betaproteobacteria bacterium]|nr:hypothetical protein [Betaproteobacteria bacterium]
MNGAGAFSSLAVSALVLVVLGVAAVLGYNAWQSRRRGARLREVATPAPSAAASGAGGRTEPSLGMADDPAQAAPGEPPRIEDAVGAAPVASLITGVCLSPLTDCLVEFDLPEPVSAERLLSGPAALRRVGGKPVALEGCAASADEQPDAVWEPLAPGQRLSRLRVGVLLANRNGALNAMEFSEFVAAVQALADRLGLLADIPDMTAVLQRARALDETCAALDAMVGVNVLAPQALGLADLARLAQEAGCVERGNNRHVCLGPAGEVLFSVSLGDAPDRISLLIDVPRAPLAAEPWARLLDCARHCALRLDGRLVDDQGRALTQAVLLRIGEQLAARQQALVDAGLSPGSPLALRVFN